MRCDGRQGGLIEERIRWIEDTGAVEQAMAGYPPHPMRRPGMAANIKMALMFCAFGGAISIVWLFAFGGVTVLLYLWLLQNRRNSGMLRSVGVSCFAGMAGGSLWWWASWGPWTFSLLHGGLWGTLIGLAIGRCGDSQTQKAEDSSCSRTRPIIKPSMNI